MQKSKLPKVKATIGSNVKLHLKLCLSHNLKTTEANLMKLHRKIKHKEKVCSIQDLGCHPQGQGHCQGLKVKICFCNYFKTT